MMVEDIIDPAEWYAIRAAELDERMEFRYIAEFKFAASATVHGVTVAWSDIPVFFPVAAAKTVYGFLNENDDYHVFLEPMGVELEEVEVFLDEDGCEIYDDE